MGPLSWIKNLIATFLGDGGKKKEMNVVAKAMLIPDLPVDFKLDATWQRMHTLTRAYADEAWIVEGVQECEPVWYLRFNDLVEAPLTVLYSTADGLDPAAAQQQVMKIIEFLHGRLLKQGWSVGDREKTAAGDQIVYAHGEDLRVIETKLRGSGTWLVGLYIPSALRPEGVQVDEAILNKKGSLEAEEVHPSRR